MTVVAGASLLGGAAACSGGSAGSPTAVDPQTHAPAPLAPRDTTPFVPPPGGLK
jgi:hypothetical protein